MKMILKAEIMLSLFNILSIFPISILFIETPRHHPRNNYVAVLVMIQTVTNTVL
jgi:hypothetical protein